MVLRSSLLEPPVVPVVCVLRSGGEYRPQHVERLRRQLLATSPSLRLTTLTDLEDIPASLPLEYKWPGWWSKLEICRPDLRGPLLYLDLDTTLLGDLAPLVDDSTRSVVLRDFFRLGDAVQSSMMLLTEGDRRLVWDHWIEDPEDHIARYEVGGDQMIFEAVVGPRAARWQDEFPGQVISYKTDVLRPQREVGEEARVVIFHGRPRPWEVELPEERAG